MLFRLGTHRLWFATAVFLGILTLGRQASAQFATRYDSDGTEWIVNRETGKSAVVLPGPGRPGRDLGNAALTRTDTSYDNLISENARLNNIRPELIRAVVSVESDFNPNARSPKGALGLMQLMPATARQFNVTNPFDPAQNIGAGSAYLRQLLDRYDDNEELALAAYNAGPGAVDKYGQNIPPYRETQHYVDKVSGMAGEATVTTVSSTTFYKIVGDIPTYTNKKPR